jgi:hypothetical protein
MFSRYTIQGIGEDKDGQRGHIIGATWIYTSPPAIHAKQIYDKHIILTLLFCDWKGE